MSNELFIKQYQKIYPSLKYFIILNDRLILKLQTTYVIPFTHINLSHLNPQIFSLNPIELFQSLYILELFYHPTLEPKEIDFITKYVNKYVELNNLVLSNQSEEANRVNALSIPIYISYNDNFINTPCATLINDICNKNVSEIEHGEGKGMRLVLKNPNYEGEQEEEEYYNFLEKAGFSTFLLIAVTVIITFLYITSYILNG